MYIKPVNVSAQQAFFWLASIGWVPFFLWHLALYHTSVWCSGHPVHPLSSCPHRWGGLYPRAVSTIAFPFLLSLYHHEILPDSLSIQASKSLEYNIINMCCLVCFRHQAQCSVWINPKSSSWLLFEEGTKNTSFCRQCKQGLGKSITWSYDRMRIWSSLCWARVFNLSVTSPLYPWGKGQLLQWTLCLSSPRSSTGQYL